MRKISIIAVLTLFTIVALSTQVSAFTIEPETYLSYTGQNIVIDATEFNKVIVEAKIYLDTGEKANLTIYYGTETLQGYIEYSRPNFFTSVITLKLGDKQVNLTDYDVLGLEKCILLTYSYNEQNKTTSISLIYDDGSIFKRGVEKAIEDLEFKPIYRLDINANSEVRVSVGVASYQAYQEGWETTKNATQPVPIPYIGDITNIITGSYNLLSNIFWYFKLIFIDNGLLTFALFESLLLAYSAISSRDIFTFYRRWINAHVKLIEFVISVISKLIEIFSNIIQALKPF